MPRDKDLKRIIRKRMEKTGEAYTSARSHLLGKTSQRDDDVRAATPATSAEAGAIVPAEAGESAPAEAAVPAAAPDFAAIAGMSDAAVEEKTGRDWAGWVEVLDAVNAATLEHGAIARIVSEEHGVPSWWTQTVTVGYERIKGLRERGQRRDGGWEANRSRTFAVSVDTLFDACAEVDFRARWLPDVAPTLRTARKPKSIRLGWEDGTIVVLWFTAKGDAKSSVAVQHTKLSDRESAESLKQYWGERLDALARALEPEGRTRTSAS